MADAKDSLCLGSGIEFRGIQDRKILVIDDSWTQRSHLISLVKGMGATEVFEAADGIEALEVVDREADVDLIFCDLEMPRMDGVAFIGEIAARGLSPNLLISSSLDTGILESVKHMAWSFGLPCSGVLTKPIHRQGLIDVLSAPPFVGEKTPSSLSSGGRGSLTLQDIRTGLKNREFECFYQPQVSMQDGTLKGVEALVRWHHPDLGTLRPAHFLPQMEGDPETVSSLTLQIFEGFAEHNDKWEQEGLQPDISVNLSAVSLSTPGFADRILETAALHDLNPKKMVLEVTESASISHLGHTLSNLTRLRMRGFRLSIDDFGTGYATYEQLERIPFTELKIDMSITRELPKSRKHSILAKSLLKLAKDLRLHTVAEGIETQESWNVLKNSGCHCGQGYYLARPMAGIQIPNWSRQTRIDL